MLPIPQSMGYMLVGARIDPHDWGEGGRRASARGRALCSACCDRRSTARDGHIVMLHDGGGDRSHTIAALPQIIDGLRAEGFQIVPSRS